MPELFLNGRAELHCGDSAEVLKSIPDCTFDAVVTDPPYALVSVVKRFGSKGAAPVIVPEGGSGAYARTSAGFMGQKWDTGETAHNVKFWTEVLRVLKPGGHLVASSGTRTYHRLACAIEDGGFEIRDMVAWLYGSGFPKSHDVSKGIDKAAGHQRASEYEPNMGNEVFGKGMGGGKHNAVSEPPITPAAQEWEGWGTALKPAIEPIVLARKPLVGTVAQNVLQHRTGAINIDGCRVATEAPRPGRSNERSASGLSGEGGAVTYGKYAVRGSIAVADTTEGRWPANVVHDGSEEVLEAFPDTAPSTIGKPRGAASGDGWGMTATGAEYDDRGSAARFFYTAKADADDRLGSKHPTVKPVDLMQWLVRLVTPKGGLVLDPFAGTGTTAEACFREGMRCTLIEMGESYQDDIRRRMRLVMGGPEERKRESIKAKMKGQPVDDGPLFSTTG